MTTILRRLEVGKILPLVSSVVHRDEWLTFLHKIRKRSIDNPYIADYLADQFRDAIALAEIFEFKKLRQRMPKLKSEEQIRGATLAVQIEMLHRRLSEIGRKRLAGMIRAGLSSDGGLGPLSVEFATSLDLEQRGWTIRYEDMEDRARFDMLVMKPGLDVEVECKYVSADLGRKIHRKDFFNFLNTLQPNLRKFELLRGGHQLDVVLDNRFVADVYVHRKIAGDVGSLTSAQMVVRGESWKVSYQPFSTAELGLIYAEEPQAVRRWLDRRLQAAIGTSNVMRSFHSSKTGGVDRATMREASNQTTSYGDCIKGCFTI